MAAAFAHYSERRKRRRTETRQDAVLAQTKAPGVGSGTGKGKKHMCLHSKRSNTNELSLVSVVSVKVPASRGSYRRNNASGTDSLLRTDERSAPGCTSGRSPARACGADARDRRATCPRWLGTPPSASHALPAETELVILLTSDEPHLLPPRLGQMRRSRLVLAGPLDLPPRRDGVLL